MPEQHHRFGSPAPAEEEAQPGAQDAEGAARCLEMFAKGWLLAALHAMW